MTTTTTTTETGRHDVIIRHNTTTAISAPPARRLSILVIGANGCIGQSIISAASRSKHMPKIHAFVRNPESIVPPYRFLCTSIIQGDSRSPYEIGQAINEIHADHIILCVGNNNEIDDMDNDLRESSAISLVCALEDTQRNTYIRVTIFSISVLSLFKPLISTINSHIQDQKRQENTLISSFLSWNCLDHLLIIRMKNGLIINDNKRKNHIHEYEISNFRGRSSKVAFLPLRSVQRDDMAEWLINRICLSLNSSHMNKFGGIIGITSSISIF